MTPETAVVAAPAVDVIAETLAAEVAAFGPAEIVPLPECEAVRELRGISGQRACFDLWMSASENSGADDKQSSYTW